ncbi:MAG: PRC-barrel domain-containing protein [Anaerolinea sp.]|nr:PRC-barrel domain-containing protein [Anaerolinea sp.]
MTTSSMRLLVSGQTDLTGGEVARGMPVLDRDGSRVGAVAAVVQTGTAKTITHLLLGQVPPTAVYRLVPLDLLDRLDGECIWLRASHQQIAALPIHQPDCYRCSEKHFGSGL